MKNNRLEDVLSSCPYYDEIINFNVKDNDEITVVFITHREMVLEDCDRTITVANGTVTEN